MSRGEIMTIFRKGELFSGPGGIALGAKNASVFLGNEEYKIQHVWANDFDHDSCETFRLNITPDNPQSVIEGKVEDLNLEDLPPIDAFTFGFPCNDFSGVGKKRGTDGYFGKLYKYGIKVIEKFNPQWFLAENVEGLSSANQGEAFRNILSELSSVGKGYTLTRHLYKFQEYGVSQLRHRIIIVGIRNDIDVTFKVPAPITKSHLIPVSKVLEDMPNDLPNHELPVHKKEVIERLKKIPPGENAWYSGLPEEYRLKVKGLKLSSIYRRLHPDFPSYTVTASGGGGTHGYHYAEPRALTNRERARIQSFPDDYKFIGKKESVRKQIGMAVPPQGVQVIFEAILKTFAGIEYKNVNSNINMEELIK